MIYLSVEGERHGPFTTEELSELWKAGEIDPAHAKYWYRGMPGWLPVSAFTPPSRDPRTAASAIRLTTVNEVAKHDVEVELEIVSAECVLGMNVWQDFLAKLSDSAGGRSETMQATLKQARRTCLQELRREAFDLGADAVIGVNLAYSEISGPGKSMLFVVASGTAVRLAPPRLRSE